MTTLRIAETSFSGADQRYTVYEKSGTVELPIDASPTRRGAEAIMQKRQFEINRKRMDALK